MPLWQRQEVQELPWKGSIRRRAAHNIMTLRNSILFLLISTFLIACFGRTQNKQYSVTTCFISFDSSSSSNENAGQKFKYSHEEYNADSNLIYQELYATPNNIGNMWGKLLETTKFFYDGKEKIKAEREFGIAYPTSEIGRGKGKNIYTYKYHNGKLVEWLSDRKPIEQYQYDNQQLIEKRIINVLNIPEYYRFIYTNDVKNKSKYFVADTITSVDTFIYDNNKKLVEEYSYDNGGEKIGHRLYIRNDKGQPIEEKWREPYKGWRMGMMDKS